MYGYNMALNINQIVVINIYENVKHTCVFMYGKKTKEETVN